MSANGTAVLDRSPLVPPDAEVKAIEQLNRDLKAHAPEEALLVFPDGSTGYELPRSVYEVLVNVVHHMAHGDSITIVPYHKELTTQEAAEILNMSRPSLVRLLDRGELPFRRTETGTHRRVLLSDVLEYRDRRSRERKESLGRMARMSQELGIY